MTYWKAQPTTTIIRHTLAPPETSSPDKNGDERTGTGVGEEGTRERKQVVAQSRPPIVSSHSEIYIAIAGERL